MRNSFNSLPWHIEQARGIKSIIHAVGEYLEREGFHAAANRCFDEELLVLDDALPAAVEAYEEGWNDAKDEDDAYISDLQSDLDDANDRLELLRQMIASLANETDDDRVAEILEKTA